MATPATAPAAVVVAPASLDKLGILPNIANSEPNAYARLCAIGFDRWMAAENAPATGDDAWKPCVSQRVAELLVTEAAALQSGGCYRADRRSWSPRGVALPNVIRVFGVFPASPATCAHFLLSSTQQASKAINPKFKRYEKTQIVDKAQLSPTAQQDGLQGASYVYLQINATPELDRDGNPAPDAVAGLRDMDALVFMQHRSSPDGDIILTTSAYHGAQKEDGTHVRALTEIDYQCLEPVAGPGGAVWTRFTMGNCVSIPGITPSKALTAQLRGSIKRCSGYMEALRKAAPRK